MVKHKILRRRGLSLLFCAILIFGMLPLTVSADTAVISSAPMTSFFETYTSTGYWVDLQTPAHWITATGEVAYCLQTSKDNPYNAGYYTIEGDEVYDYGVLTGLQAILDHGYPATTMGFSDEEARYATANAIRFWLAENYADGVPQYLNLNVNGDWIRGKSGYEDLFRYSLYLLYMARTQNTTPVEGGTLVFTPDEITLTEDATGQYFTGDVYLTKNISGDYSLMDNAPEGTLTITGHTGTQSETLTLQVPASYANQSCMLCAYGMDEASAAALFFWAPAAGNNQRIVTYVLDSTQSVFVRGFLTINVSAPAERTGSIRITKTGENGDPLQGVSFSLYDSNQVLIDSGTTDASGQITFTGLTLGDYYYQETATLSGYVLDSAMHAVTVSESNQTVEVTVTNALAAGSLQITKTDGSGNALFGVEFTLYDSAGNTLDSQTTDIFGVVSFGNLPLGNYYYAETAALTGYVLDSTQHEVTISTNGQTVEVSVTNTLAHASIVVNKTDYETGAPLPGVHFTLSDSNGTLVDEGDTGADGTLSFSNLPLGTYSLLETSVPSGYVLDSTPISISLDTDGQTVTRNITNSRALGAVSITKTDANTGSPLAGVHFALLDSSAAVVAEGDTGADGTLLLSGIPLGTYTLRETATVSGYVLDETPRTVEITTHGQSVTVNATNTPARGGVTVLKTDASTGNALPGVHFILKDSSDLTVDEGDTDANGRLSFTALPLGTYSLIETYAPAGYVLDGTPRSVEITTHGQTVELSVTNTPATASIVVVKTDAVTGAALSGVHFTLADSTGAVVSSGGTDENGTLSFPNLPLGTYTLTETGTRNGYVLDSSPVTITLDTNGQTVTQNITNTPARGSVSILKIDSETGAALAGVHFVLRDEAGAVAAEGDTGADGTLTLPNIPVGWYTLAETATISGYLLDETRTDVHISENGQIVELSLQNSPIHSTLEILKRDAHENIALMGAGYRLYDSAGTQVAEGYTDASGKVSFPNLARGQYVYQEFKAPKGYLLDENRYSLSITKNGSTVTETRTNERRPGTLIVQKQDGSGSPLAGAAFLLEYSTDNGSTWQPVFYRVGDELTGGGCTTQGLDGGQLTTGADGKATFTGLRADGLILYRLTETKAPPGRTLLADSILVGTLPVESDNLNAEDSEVFDSRAFHYTLKITATDAWQYRLPETGGDDGLKLLPLAMMFMAVPIIFISFKSKKKRRIFA